MKPNIRPRRAEVRHHEVHRMKASPKANEATGLGEWNRSGGSTIGKRTARRIEQREEQCQDVPSQRQSRLSEKSKHCPNKVMLTEANGIEIEVIDFRCEKASEAPIVWPDGLKNGQDGN